MQVQQPRIFLPKQTELDGGVMCRLRMQNATVLIPTAQIATEQQACMVIWNHPPTASFFLLF